MQRAPRRTRRTAPCARRLRGVRRASTACRSVELMLPPDKLDALVRRRDFVEAELVLRPRCRDLRRPVARARRARPGRRADPRLARRAGRARRASSAMLVEAGVAAEMAALAEEERRELGRARRGARDRDPPAAAAQGRGRREDRHPRSPRRHRRRRGGAVRRRPAAHVSALCRPAGLEGRDAVGKRAARSAATRRSSPRSAARASSPG